MLRDIPGTGPAAPVQARSQGGANLQNIKDKHADQSTKSRATLHRTHVLPLLNRRVWKTHFQRTTWCISKVFVWCYRVYYVINLLKTTGYFTCHQVYLLRTYSMEQSPS
jgi:hypothetical protein